MTETGQLYIILISATGHMTLAGIYYFLPFVLILYLLPSASISEDLGYFPGEVAHAFIPNGSVPFCILPGLGCCGFL